MSSEAGGRSGGNFMGHTRKQVKKKQYQNWAGRHYNPKAQLDESQVKILPKQPWFSYPQVTITSKKTEAIKRRLRKKRISKEK